MRRHAKAIVAISALLLLTLALGVMTATAAAPVVSIDAPSAVSYTSAHVSGEVDPEDQETSYRFQYSANPEGEGWFDAAFQGPLAAGSGGTPVEDDLTGLKPGTEYFVRLVAENADGLTISAEPNPSFTTLAVAPPSVSILAPSSVTGSSAHFEGQIDPEAPGGNPAAFDVNWHFECTPACPGLSGGTIPADSSSHTVEADTTGLKPATAYEVTLVAENAGGQASAGPEAFSTPTVAPEIVSFYPGPLYTEANFFASVNPGGLETSYHFEYGTTTAYGQSTPTKSIPAGSDPVAIKAGISGLSPDSDYHAKLVVSNAEGTVESGDRAFTTQSDTVQGNCPNEAVRIQQGSQRLPDCRAYELVSAVDKNGVDVQSPIQISEDGSAVAWTSLGAYADSVGANAEVPYVARRNEAGSWTTKSFFPSYNGVYRPGYLAYLGGYSFSDDLRLMSFVTNGSFDPADDDTEATEYGTFQKLDVYRVGEDREATWISHGSEGVGPNDLLEAQTVGMSRDGSAVFFKTTESLSPEAPPGGQQLYRWTGGTVQLVGRDENGVPLQSAYLGANSTAVFPSTGDAGRLPDSTAVSRNGEDFVYAGNPGGGIPSQLYLHKADGSIIRISSSQRAGEEGDPANEPAAFVHATGDLAIIYFRSAAQLTDDAPFGGGDYSYDVSTEKLTFSNVDDYVNSSFEGGFMNASEDGELIYFASVKALAPGATEEPGRLNMYMKEPSGYTYIGRLSLDDTSFIHGPVNTVADTGGGISTDGTKLAFFSRYPLTGFDTEEKTQLYLVDADTEQVTCVSCSKSLGHSGGVASPASSDYGIDGRILSADGRILVFGSTEPLVPDDSNDAADVYEYSDGKLRLLSDGNSQADSTLVGMSTSGKDVFIRTRASLVGADGDRGLYDIYDVRVGGGALEAEAPFPCGGSSCQGTPAIPPIATPPGSRAVDGPGNTKRGKHRKHHRGKKKAGKRGKKHSQKHQHRKGGHRAQPADDNRGVAR